MKNSSTSPSIEFESLNPDQKKSSLNLTKFLNKFVIKPEKKIFSRFEVFALLFIISGCNTAKKKSSVNEGQSEGESQSGIVADG